MSIISRERISLKATATDKPDAIRQAGELLVATGCVLPKYVEGMLTRERSMSTSLGVGVAIPHGMDENRDHVLKTALSVVQLKEGIEWEEGDTVFLVVGIAATSDEHIGVLANLAEVVENEEALAELLKTDDPDVIVNYLGEKDSS